MADVGAHRRLAALGRLLATGGLSLVLPSGRRMLPPAYDDVPDHLCLTPAFLEQQLRRAADGVPVDLIMSEVSADA